MLWKTVVESFQRRVRADAGRQEKRRSLGLDQLEVPSQGRELELTPKVRNIRGISVDKELRTRGAVQCTDPRALTNRFNVCSHPPSLQL